MKLFIQIPCLNEATTLPLVLESIPRQIPGIDQIEILVIDDGCTDDTVQVAREYGVRHFVIHRQNLGLAQSFSDGLDYAIGHGADIIVNTDGDNQYPQQRIPELVYPLLDGVADITVGDRQTATIPHFSPGKRFLQKIGSAVVSHAAGIRLPDAASGFRGYTRQAALSLNVITQFSYCMETIIQAGQKRLRIVSVPITTNPKTRESRLFSSSFQHTQKSAKAIIRSYLMFKPHVVFVSLGVFFFAAALIPFVRYLVLMMLGRAGGHIQSLLLGVALLVAAIVSFALLVIADLMRTNRVLAEQTLARIKDMQYGDRADSSALFPEHDSEPWESANSM